MSNFTFADRDEEFKSDSVEYYEDWISFGPITEDMCSHLVKETRKLLQEEFSNSLFSPSALLSPQR